MKSQVITNKIDGENTYTLEIERDSRGGYSTFTQFTCNCSCFSLNSLSLEEVNDIIKAATELREILVAELVAKAMESKSEVKQKV